LARFCRAFRLIDTALSRSLSAAPRLSVDAIPETVAHRSDSCVWWIHNLVSWEGAT
jgi:hypothetical protein